VVAQQRRKGFFIECDHEQERFFHFLFVLDLDQGVQEKGLDQGGVAAAEGFFHGDPQIEALGEHTAIQPEPFFHFSFNEISLNRVADLAVNGDGKAAVGAVVFQKIQKKNHSLFFWHFSADKQTRLLS
jgi:hypothetical protein